MYPCNGVLSRNRFVLSWPRKSHNGLVCVCVRLLLILAFKCFAHREIACSLSRILTPLPRISIINTITRQKPSKTRRWVACVIFPHPLLCFCAPTPPSDDGAKKSARAFRRQCDWHSIVARSDADSSIFIAHCSKSNKRPAPQPPRKNPACHSPRAHPYFAHCLPNQCAIFAGAAPPVNIEMRGTDMRANQSRSVVFHWLIHHNGESCSQRLKSFNCEA